MSLTMLGATAHAATYKVTAETAYAAVKNAKSGDVFQFQGDFPGPLNWRNLPPFNRSITLDMSDATIASVRFEGVSGIDIVGGKYSGTAAVPANQGTIHIASSKNISITGAQIRGGVIRLRSSSKISITDTMIQDTGVGIQAIDIDNLNITELSLWNIGVDGIDLFSVRNAKVNYVTCAGFKRSGDSHPDCIQLANYKGSPTSENIKISFVMVSGRTQGVAAFPTGGRYSNISFDHIWVMTQNYPQGIAIYDTDGASITNSVAVTIPGGKAGFDIGIRMNDSTSGIRCNNHIVSADRQARPADTVCSRGKGGGE
jgi:hypothetical protein